MQLLIDYRVDETNDQLIKCSAIQCHAESIRFALGANEPQTCTLKRVRSLCLLSKEYQ